MGFPPVMPPARVTPPTRAGPIPVFDVSLFHTRAGCGKGGRRSGPPRRVGAASPPRARLPGGSRSSRADPRSSARTSPQARPVPGAGAASAATRCAGRAPRGSRCRCRAGSPPATIAAQGLRVRHRSGADPQEGWSIGHRRAGPACRRPHYRGVNGAHGGCVVTAEDVSDPRPRMRWGHRDPVDPPRDHGGDCASGGAVRRRESRRHRGH